MKRCRACSVVLTDDIARWRLAGAGSKTRDTVCRLCWNKRRRDARRIARGLPLDAPLSRAPAILERRVCNGPCGRDLPSIEFGLFTYQGQTRQRATCRDCRNLWKRGRWAETHPQRPAPPKPAPVQAQRRAKPKVVKPAAPAQPRLRKSHPCVGCGTVLFTQAKRCSQCKQNMTAANLRGDDRRMTLRHTARLLRQVAAGEIAGVLMLPSGEAWRLDDLCNGCGVPIWDGSKCYSCAKGTARTLSVLAEKVYAPIVPAEVAA